VIWISFGKVQETHTHTQNEQSIKGRTQSKVNAPALLPITKNCDRKGNNSKVHTFSSSRRERSSWLHSKSGQLPNWNFRLQRFSRCIASKMIFRSIYFVSVFVIKVEQANLQQKRNNEIGYTTSWSNVITCLPMSMRAIEPFTDIMNITNFYIIFQSVKSRVG
jgi:hypothetical protein